MANTFAADSSLSANKRAPRRSLIRRKEKTTKKRKKRQNVGKQNDKRKALNDEIKNGNIKRQNTNKTKR